MADDIVKRLNEEYAEQSEIGRFDLADLIGTAIDEIERLEADLHLHRCSTQEAIVKEVQARTQRATAEIERLRAENERLRAAGDKLADARPWCGYGNEWGDAARLAWQEARRG